MLTFGSNIGSVGRTWGFPALCTHVHAWPLISFPFLAGLRFSAAGLHVAPALPRHLGPYSFTTPLASIAYDGSRTYSGYFHPLASHVPLEVHFDLSAVAKQWRVERNEVVDIDADDDVGRARRQRVEFAAAIADPIDDD